MSTKYQYRDHEEYKGETGRKDTKGGGGGREGHKDENEGGEVQEEKEAERGHAKGGLTSKKRDMLYGNRPFNSIVSN